MATMNLADPTARDATGAEHASTTVPAFVTAAELKRSYARPWTLGRTGTLRLETRVPLWRLGLTIAFKIVFWDILERRRAKALVRAWIDRLTAVDTLAHAPRPARGLRVRLGRVLWSLAASAWSAFIVYSVLTYA